MYFHLLLDALAADGNAATGDAAVIGVIGGYQRGGDQADV